MPELLIVPARAGNVCGHLAVPLSIAIIRVYLVVVVMFAFMNSVQLGHIVALPGVT